MSSSPRARRHFPALMLLWYHPHDFESQGLVCRISCCTKGATVCLSLAWQSPTDAASSQLHWCLSL